jgi:3-phytase
LLDAECDTALHGDADGDERGLIRTGFGLVLALALAGCAGDQDTPATAQPSDQGDIPVRTGTYSVEAVAETEPVPHDGDAADDPAIWVHPTEPERSLIIGTDKQRGGGLGVYDLEGRELAFQADGAMNNVDVRGSVVLAGNEDDNTLAIYQVEPDGPRLVPISRRPITPGIRIYGTCLYRSEVSGGLYAFVTSERGEVEQWALTENDQQYDGELVRNFAFDSQTEACVADDQGAVVYFGEESTGIWRLAAEPDDDGEATLVDGTGSDGNLAADVEGLAIASDMGGGVLIASSQGDDRYVVYRLEDGEYLATFTIEGSVGVDEVSGTDGLEVTTEPLGGPFDQGLLVVQDGRNDDQNQNFKLVPLRSLLASATD